jgi:hypothetical protein
VKPKMIIHKGTNENFCDFMIPPVDNQIYLAPFILTELYFRLKDFNILQ